MVTDTRIMNSKGGLGIHWEGTEGIGSVENVLHVNKDKIIISLINN